MNKRFAAPAALVLTLWAASACAQDSGRHRFFDRLDANSDGSLTREEVQKQFPNFSAEHFKQADKSGDGKLSLEEWREFVKAKRAERKASAAM